MLYEPYEPFAVPRKWTNSGQRALDFSAKVLRDFWTEIDDEYPGLSGAKGCYIFAMRAGKGIRPWYVGQTRRAFSKECFKYHKRNLYTDAYQNNRKGTPLLFLLARSTPGGKLSKGSPNSRELDFLEQLLIGLALGENKELLNKRTTKYLRALKLPGVINTDRGKGTRAVNDLRVVLGQTAAASSRKRKA